MAYFLVFLAAVLPVSGADLVFFTVSAGFSEAVLAVFAGLAVFSLSAGAEAFAGFTAVLVSVSLSADFFTGFSPFFFSAFLAAFF